MHHLSDDAGGGEGRLETNTVCAIFLTRRQSGTIFKAGIEESNYHNGKSITLQCYYQRETSAQWDRERDGLLHKWLQ